MQDVVYVGQPVEIVLTIKEPDGTVKDLTGFTGTIAVQKGGVAVSGSPFAGAVDTGDSTVTATVPKTVHVDANRGILVYYPVVNDGTDDYPGSPNHYHLKEVG